MSYISDYECGAIDRDEYEQFGAEENRRDRIDGERYYEEFTEGDVDE